MLHKPSKYQAPIYDSIINDRHSLTIQACAGSGKTTTIVNSIDLLPKDQKVIFFAFNRSIVDELKLKVPKNVDVSTIHRFGYRTILNWYGKVKINEEKVFWLGVKMFDSWKIQENKFSYVYRVAKLVDFMRLHMVYEGEEEIFHVAERHSIPIFSAEIDHAIKLLEASNKMAFKEIDFTDMIHIPAYRNMKLRKYDYVYLDECQDASIAQQTIVSNTIRPLSGRLISVGDRNQSIYQFAGADSNSFDRIKKIRPNTKEFPLSICYRCAKNIVREAQEYVPDIEWHDEQIDGVVKEGGVNDINGDVYVLCRNTKPLVQLMFLLLSKGIKCNIKGKEIGNSMVAFIKKTKQKTTENLKKHLEVNKIRLMNELKERGVVKPELHDTFIDFAEKCDIITIIAARFSTTSQLIKYIESVFLDEEVPGVTLLTVHKSKGLEKDKVFFLNPELIPSKFALTNEQKKQEWNLMYVAITRAKKELIYIRNFNPM